MSLANRSVEQRVAGIQADTVRGSSAIAADAATILRDASLECAAGSSAALVRALTELAIALVQAQPTMAPLVTLARDVLGALDPSQPIELVRRSAARAAGGYPERLAAARAAAAERTAALLPPAGAILTLSASSAVGAALLRAAGTRDALEVICLESRPMNEGRSLASDLAAAGVPVLLAVDAATESLIERCTAVLLGADSIGDRGIVNKIGSRGVAHAADRAGVPTYVVADSSKLLPPGFPQPLEDDRPAAEVWRDAGPVAVWNRYFEVLPYSAVDGIVLEDGVFTVAELNARRNALEVPQELRDRAAAHG